MRDKDFPDTGAPSATRSEFYRALMAELPRDPRRNDLRAMLAEQMYRENNVKAFNLAVSSFMNHLNRDDQADWNRLQLLAREFAPGNAICTDDFETRLTRRSPATGPLARAGKTHKRFYDSLEGTTLDQALGQLETSHQSLRSDPTFAIALSELMLFDLGRPTAVDHLRSLSNSLHHGQIYVKREDLRTRDATPKAHVYGQVLMARYGRKRTIVTDGSESAHGAAVATAADVLGLEAVIYVPADRLQLPESRDLGKMRASKARLIPVQSKGGGTLDDCRRRAMAHWLDRPADTAYVSSLLAGPSPLPAIVRDFESVVGQEIFRHWIVRHGELPQALVCSAETGFEAYAFVTPFLDRPDVAMDCVSGEPHDGDLAGTGVDGKLSPANFPRELSLLKASGRVSFPAVSESAANDAAALCDQYEGYRPQGRNREVLARAIDIAKNLSPSQSVVALFG